MSVTQDKVIPKGSVRQHERSKTANPDDIHTA